MHITVTGKQVDVGDALRGHVEDRITAGASANDAYAGFDAAAERVEKRLRRYKRRLRNHRKSVPVELVEAPSYILASEEEHDDHIEDVQPIIVAESTTDIPTVSVSEAVMRLDLENVPVLMFRNSAHGGLSVVYRREDGNFGWIDPKNPV